MPLHTPFVPVPPSAAPLNPSDLLNEIEAAALLNVAAKTLSNWRTRGEGPRTIKIGARLVRYRRGDLDAFIEAGTASKAT